MKATINNRAIIRNTEYSELQNLKAALTFDNPKYAEAQKFGRYTGNMPKTIELFECDYAWDSEVSLIVPRGAVFGMEFESIDDERIEHPVKIRLSADINLRDYQRRAVDQAAAADGGLIVSPTGSGKTIMALSLAERLGQRALILVKSKELMKQWVSEIYDLTDCIAGIIGGGKWEEGEQFTVATVQTLIKHEQSLDYGLVIIDEAHNVPAQQAFNVINRQGAKYRFGLSATPQRRDGLEFMIHAALGPIVAEVNEHDLAGAVLPVRVESIKVPFFGNPGSWGEFLEILENDRQRNQLLINKTLEAVARSAVVVVTQTVRHGEILAELMTEAGSDPVLLHGGLKARDRADAMNRSVNAQVIIGTVQLLGEGLNWPHIGAVVFAAPVSASVDREDPAATRLMQAIGRARRPYPGRAFAFVVDIIDQCGFGVSAFNKRKIIYENNDFLLYSLTQTD